MIAAHLPVQRPRDARLLVVDAQGRITHVPRSQFVDLLRPGDLVVANDAATLPASLNGVHEPTGGAVEVRLAGRSSLSPGTVQRFTAVVFGAGDFRLRTEDRPLPPALTPGDRLLLGSVSGRIEALLEHPRLVSLSMEGTPDAVWAGIARHGRPIQYAHVPLPLAVWDVWTPIANEPVAFEPPSASFAVDWAAIKTMRQRGIGFATITLAAGISSTGDPDLDRRLPLDEPYRIPETTAEAIRRARARNGRIVAVGTTVVRALEHAAADDGIVRAGEAVANQRVGPATPLRVADVILSGTHEPASSHYQLLRAFTTDEMLTRIDRELEDRAYRTHEFGDSVLIEKISRAELQFRLSARYGWGGTAAHGYASLTVGAAVAWPVRQPRGGVWQKHPSARIRVASVRSRQEGRSGSTAATIANRQDSESNCAATASIRRVADVGRTLQFRHHVGSDT